MGIEKQLTAEQQAMLRGDQGLARQMGMRLLLDLAAMSGATELVPIQSAHLSGVSPLTGGFGLRHFLSRLATEPGDGVAVPTTLNSAGCDEEQFDAMRIVASDFLAHHQEIIRSYAGLGVQTIQSCVPYEWEELLPEPGDSPALVAWAESNAICYANSYASLRTNRESGLSALAYALTGYAPRYGLLDEAARLPNLRVVVTASLTEPTDLSILGDWIGKQRQSSWSTPYGLIPLIEGLPTTLSHEQKKALSAAAANYGCALLYLADPQHPVNESAIQATITFDTAQMEARYAALAPNGAASLVVIGCPQASLGELQAAARLLQGKSVTADPAPADAPPPLWFFTSARTKAIAEQIGVADVIRSSGALLLENTCPEVVPYDQTWVHHILTNSMKAEHYIQSGLNGIPASVMRLADCIAVATGELQLDDHQPEPSEQTMSRQVSKTHAHSKEQPLDAAVTETTRTPSIARGHGLPSQPEFTVRGEAFVTPVPITFLGYVNRLTGVIEEMGHPADGQSMAGKIALFPRGTGSSVAPYVLLELFYRGQAPIAIINSEIDQQTAPACSLESIPYAYDFDTDLFASVQTGDLIELTRRGDVVTLQILEKSKRDQ